MSKCEHCGANPYYAREFPRVRDEAQFWQKRAKALAAEVQALKLDIEFQFHRERTDVAWLQRKVVAQRRELQRLNDAHNTQRSREGLTPRPDVEATSLTKVEVDAAHTRAIIKERESR